MELSALHRALGLIDVAAVGGVAAVEDAPIRSPIEEDEDEEGNIDSEMTK